MTTKTSDTLVNSFQELASLDLKSMNYILTRLWQRVAMVYDKVNGSEILGNSLVKMVQDLSTSQKIEYPKGRIVVKNGIDKVQYLIDHRAELAKTLQVQASEIY